MTFIFNTYEFDENSKSSYHMDKNPQVVSSDEYTLKIVFDKKINLYYVRLRTNLGSYAITAPVSTYADARTDITNVLKQLAVQNYVDTSFNKTYHNTYINYMTKTGKISDEVLDVLMQETAKTTNME